MTVEKYMERDSYMDAEEALKFGIVDAIVNENVGNLKQQASE